MANGAYDPAMSYAEISPFPPSRREGIIELRLRGASQEQMALGIAAAREVFNAADVSPVHASICHAAILAHEFDPALPVPDAEILAGAVAYERACDAAVRAAGGVLAHGDELHIDQGSDLQAERLWSAVPTLRLYRARYCLDARKRDAADEVAPSI